MDNKRPSILIITNYFVHKNAIASVRSDKIAKYFQKENWDVTVLTSLQRALWDDKKFKHLTSPGLKDHKNSEIIFIKEHVLWTMIFNIFYPYMSNKQSVGTESLHKKNIEKQSVIIKSIINLIDLIKLGVFKIQEILLYLSLKKGCRKLVKSKKFDLIFATYGPSPVLKLGKYIKSKSKKSVFIADFRDPWFKMSQDSKRFKSQKSILIDERKVLEKADIVTAVSYGILTEQLKNHDKLKGLKERSFVITNGYDKDDIYLSSGQNMNFLDNKINIGYTGTLYENKSDLSVLFQVITDLTRGKK